MVRQGSIRACCGQCCPSFGGAVGDTALDHMHCLPRPVFCVEQYFRPAPCPLSTQVRIVRIKGVYR